MLPRHLQSLAVFCSPADRRPLCLGESTGYSKVYKGENVKKEATELEAAFLSMLFWPSLNLMQRHRVALANHSLSLA